MIWGRIKLYAIAAGTAIFAAMAVALKYFASKAKKEKRARKQAEADRDRVSEVHSKDIEIDEEFKSRRAAAKAEVEAGRSDPVFADPNKLFRKPTDD